MLSKQKQTKIKHTTYLEFFEEKLFLFIVPFIAFLKIPVER
jgi:phosphotransferase system  glucose/maltose/N-acetylglucosamine-specific IIC component